MSISIPDIGICLSPLRATDPWLSLASIMAHVASGVLRVFVGLERLPRHPRLKKKKKILVNFFFRP